MKRHDNEIKNCILICYGPPSVEGVFSIESGSK